MTRSGASHGARGAPSGDSKVAGTPADPRRVAYEVLRAVSERDAYANLTLPGLLRQRGVTGQEAALATELCYGTLRSLGTLDAILAAASSRPLSRIQLPVLDALRLGAYQLLFTRVPAHAAVSTTVSLVRADRGQRAAGFGNAVLRRVAAQELSGWLTRLAPDDEVARLALTYAHPQWVVRAFADALGVGVADPELAAALAADNERPGVHLVALPGRIERDELAEQVGGEPGRYSPYAVRLPAGDPADLPAIGQRLAGVQDEGSQLVGSATATAPIAGEDTRWLDLCAGPGGKASLLGALAAQRGAAVTAVEVAPHRARLVRSATEGLPVRVLTADGREVGSHPDLPERGFDRVLVDAPCTGLGALRRRPESRWRRTPEDLRSVTALQRELLAAAVRAARPGGLVGYVTCSPHVAETTACVADTRRDCGVATELIDATQVLDEVAENAVELPAGPMAQLWPHRHGTDAMFVALLRRNDT